MASFRRNIEKQIKMGLNARVDALSTYGSSKPLKNPALDSVDDTEFSLTYHEQASKSPFVRLISPGEKATNILYGTFNVGDSMGLSMGNPGSQEDFFASKDAAQKLEGGAESTYYGGMTADSDGNVTNDSLKPKPGITGVEVQFLKTGGAVRKASVSWVCWTIDQLELYQRGSFLSAGRNVILDWGWVRPSKTQTLGIPQILSTDGNGKLTLDERLFKQDIVEENGKKVVKGRAPWETLYLSQYGDWSGLIGVVSKFSFQQRDDGGFDCTTEILAKGSNIFDKEYSQPKNEAGLGFPGDSTPDFGDFMEDLASSIITDGEASDDILKLTGPALDIGERIAALDLEIMLKVFSSAVENVKKDPIAVLSEDKNIAAILSPSTEGSSGIELFEKGVEGVDDDPEKLKRVKDFGSEIWVRWGWFEDVIISYYASNDISKESGRRQAEFRSITKDLQTGKVRSITIKNDPELYTYDASSFILPGQFPVEFHQQPDEKESKNPYRELADIMSECPTFSTDDSKTSGYLRNIYVNLGKIQSTFKTPGSSISSAMLRLADGLNSGINIWSLAVDRNDNLGGNADSTYYLRPADGDNDEPIDADSDPKDSYIFDNYGFNSIVEEITLSSNISDKFAVMAGYGSGRKENETDDPIAKRKKEIQNTLKSSEQLKDEQVAEELGKFFANQDNASIIANIQRIPTNTTFGPTGNGEETDLGELSDDGTLKFNHEIPKEILEITPTANVDYMDKFAAKYKDSVVNNPQLLAANKDGSLPQGMPGLAIPNKEALEAGIKQGIMVEFRRPYDLNGKMRDHFMKSMRWFLEKSPLTSLSRNTKTIEFPLSLSMGIEGCGGIFPGHMFRLAYLPELYKQVSSEFGSEDKEFNPGTFFTINSITHTIDENSWKTSIDAIFSKNNDPEESTEVSDEERKKMMDKVRQAYESNIQQYKAPS